MDIFTLGFWGVGGALMALAWMKGPKETQEAMKKSRGMMGHMIGDILGVILLIGLILALVPAARIEGVLGGSQGALSTLMGGIIGSVTLIPAFVAFPLVGSLVDAGASMVPGVAFLTTLTMVGLVTFPLEKKYFGLEFALYRNGLSFLAAMGIAFIMGGVLS